MERRALSRSVAVLVLMSLASGLPHAAELKDPPLISCFGLELKILTVVIREKLCGVTEGDDDELLALKLKEQSCSVKVID